MGTRIRTSRYYRQVRNLVKISGKIRKFDEIDLPQDELRIGAGKGIIIIYVSRYTRTFLEKDDSNIFRF